MLYPPVADLLKNIDSRYLLVNVVAQRARQIASEAEEFQEELPEMFVFFVFSYFLFFFCVCLLPAVFYFCLVWWCVWGAKAPLLDLNVAQLRS